MISITKEQLSGLPVEVYNGRAVVINYPKDADKAVRYLMTQRIVGFDTETRPSFWRGRQYTVSLLQIATHHECFLFRLKNTGFTESLKSFFECERVLKVGLSLNDDFRSLHVLADFSPKSYIDLQCYVKQYDIVDNSLQKIYAILFDKRISKSQRLSNWEADVLTESQRAYAALDAKACLDIYEHLSSNGFDKIHCHYAISEIQNQNG